MYINTYVLGVTEDRKDDYLRMATAFAEAAREYGALEIFENWELEVPDGKQTDYRKAIKAEPGEKIVLGWVIWPDRESAFRAHKGMFEGGRLDGLGEPPFDGSRMIIGGFEPLLSWRKD